MVKNNSGKLAAENHINGNIHETFQRNVLLMPENIKIQRISIYKGRFLVQYFGSEWPLLLLSICPKMLDVVSKKGRQYFPARV